MTFIDGNLFKTIAGNIYDEHGYWKNSNINSNIFFIKTDWIEDFISNHAPNYPHKIITHNSDHPIADKYIDYINNSNLSSWFASEISIKHEKLKYIPIGIPNERVMHHSGQIDHYHLGSRKIFEDIYNKNTYKSKLLSTPAFDINTNPNRKLCENICRKMGHENTRLTYTDYLSDIKNSMFCISPQGNGMISHRIWECMYLKCIPITTRLSSFTSYEGFPIIIINTWEDLLDISLNEEIYRKYIDEFDRNNLDGIRLLNNIIYEN